MRMPYPLPTRQVHLDFHTSPAIPHIGVDFDAQEFVRTLQAAHVNSITVFAKCHHGYSYYPTKVGAPHPHLQRDLMGEMIQACHAAGIKAPIYISVVWDEHAFAQHPEWRVVTPQGGIAGRATTPLEPGWKAMCINTAYADYVLAQTEEVLTQYAVDGLFFDIVVRSPSRWGGCVCATCLQKLAEAGVDPTDVEQMDEYALGVERQFMANVAALLEKHGAQSALYFNSRLRMDRDAHKGMRPETPYYSHLEIESLPGNPRWGYDHFAMYVRYFQTFGMELVGQTGRFHTTWGGFGGLRNRAALEFECFAALAHGARCGIGDQLDPRGRLQPAVYQRIGEVFAQVKEKEPWCAHTESLPEIGVFTTNTVSKGQQILMVPVDRGALHLLEQCKYQFQFLDEAADLAPYQVLVLPDSVAIGDALAAKLRAFVASGGRLLLSGSSGLDRQRNAFVLADLMGVDYLGPNEFTPDYVLVGPALQEGIEDMGHICLLPGPKVRAQAGAEVLAQAGAPYFNRTWQHFCSHQYTPLERATQDPIVAQKGGVIYIARPLFEEYAQTSQRVHRQIVHNCLKRLLPQPRVGAHNLPSTAIVTVRRQGNDLVVHLLHYVHQRRGELDIVEDALPLVDIQLDIRCERRPSAAMIVPQCTLIAQSYVNGYAHLHLDRMLGHQMILLQGAAG